MNQHDSERLERLLEAKRRRRAKKRRPAMKVSGASVKQLQRLIIATPQRHRKQRH